MNVERTIGGGVMRILAFTTILKIYYRSSFKYLVIKNIVEGIVGNSRVGLEVEPRVEGAFKLGDLSNLSIFLLMRE